MSYVFSIVIIGIILLSLGIKWEIKLKVVISWIIIITSLYCLTIYILSLKAPDWSPFIVSLIGSAQSLIITIATLLFFFFRDPEREPPNNPRVILSPADGKIAYVKEIKKGEFPFAIKHKNNIPLSELTKEEFISAGGYQVGIGMNFLNVHINRAPIAGKIMRLIRIPGKFSSLKKISSLLENERVCTIIHNDDIKIAIVQIASRLVRRIISFTKEGDTIESGQRIGMIRFGSQVDILIPKQMNLKISVKSKDEVQAGISVIASF